MNEGNGFFQRVGQFLSGKGYYMVLLGCLVALCFSALYLWSALDGAEEALQPANGQTEVDVDVETGATGLEEVQLPDIHQVVVEPPDQVTLPEPEPEPEPQPQPEPAPEPEPQPQPEPKPAMTKLLWPVEGEVCAAFSATELTYHPVLGDWRTHDGVDLAADVGTQVLAAMDGTVRSVTTQPATGTTLTLSHENGLETVYGNLNPDTLCVSEGDAVTAGEILGSVGSTGDGALPCLHFSVMEEGKAVDPLDFLA